jgi:hypothetical protein
LPDGSPRAEAHDTPHAGGSAWHSQAPGRPETVSRQFPPPTRPKSAPKPRKNLVDRSCSFRRAVLDSLSHAGGRSGCLAASRIARDSRRQFPARSNVLFPPFSAPRNPSARSAFCDPSGGSSDIFTLAICHLEKDVAILDAIREVPAPFSPDVATAEIAKTIKAYQLRTVTGDRYAGEWVREAFRKNGITYSHSELVRSELYVNFQPRLNSSTVRLLDNVKLANQIAGLERRTARGRSFSR